MQQFYLFLFSANPIAKAPSQNLEQTFIRMALGGVHDDNYFINAYNQIITGMYADQPFAIRTFLEKLKFFTIFNVVYFIWILCELLFYIITITQITCSQMVNLFISWTCSYGFELLVPVASVLIVKYGKFFRGGYALIIAMIAYKIGVVITVMAVAWKHVGHCYIPYNMRVVVILTNCLEIVCLLVEIFLLWRIKRVNREVILNNLIKKKTFAEN